MESALGLFSGAESRASCLPGLLLALGILRTRGSVMGSVLLSCSPPCRAYPRLLLEFHSVICPVSHNGSSACYCSVAGWGWLSRSPATSNSFLMQNVLVPPFPGGGTLATIPWRCGSERLCFRIGLLGLPCPLALGGQLGLRLRAVFSQVSAFHSCFCVYSSFVAIDGRKCLTRRVGPKKAETSTGKK